MGSCDSTRPVASPLIGEVELAEYERQGFVFVESAFSEDEVAVLRAAAVASLDQSGDQRIMAADDSSVRSVYGLHQSSSLFGRLVQDARLAGTASALLEHEVYVHQTQLNPKPAFGTEYWDWHQDYLYFKLDDGMLDARTLNAMLYLDDVTIFNGPLFLVPKSHHRDLEADTDRVEWRQGDRGFNPGITDGTTAALTGERKHVLRRDVLSRVIAESGLTSPLGPAGSILFFDARVIHASAANISPCDRSAFFVRYNAIDNIPVHLHRARPAWLAARSASPLHPDGGPLLDVGSAQ